jgi:predicted metal-dependent phosphoesterase TrpH
LIDLHSHTNESDGTSTPAELVSAASALGLEALGITDHDTFAGHDAAVPLAATAGLRLVCGIEISTRCHAKSVHLLGYFLNGGPTPAFRKWVIEGQESRRDRNRRLAEKLRSFGLDISLPEVEALGRSQTGRPHFAKLMLDKGYVKTREEAFEVYLDETAKAYVERHSASIEEAIREVNVGNGMAVLAHPIRLGKRKPEKEEALIAEFVELGLRGIEVWHSDHSPSDVARYFNIARKYGLAMTGGSDFHGEAKSGVRLGYGRNNLDIPVQVLEEATAFSLSSPTSSCTPLRANAVHKYPSATTSPKAGE